MYCVYKKNLCNIKIKMNLHIYKIYDLKILMNEIRSIEKVHPNNYVFWGFGVFFGLVDTSYIALILNHCCWYHQYYL